MSDAQHNIGKLIRGDAERDAIHIALAPVTAGCLLNRGDHVGFAPDGTVITGVQPLIGIVDPFLTGMVDKGQRFYMFLYPNTITALRHEWTHPAFDAADKAASEAWLRDFIKNADCPDYDTVINAAVGDHDKNARPDEYHGYYHTKTDGDFLYFGGRDAHGDIPPEFWDHVEVVTGRKITKRPSYFSCSC